MSPQEIIANAIDYGQDNNWAPDWIAIEVVNALDALGYSITEKSPQ